MSQHDYVLDNDTGQNFRTDLNNVLAAIVSNNSGLTEPTTTFAYMWWADTTTGLMKQRDSTNTTWITKGTIADAYGGLLALAGGTMTGAILADDGGTNSLPAVAFDGDANTGMFRAGADLLGFAAGGTELLRADGILGYLKMLGTKGFLAPVGTTAQRPTGVQGIIRINSDLVKPEWYNGSIWAGLGGGGGGAGFVWKTLDGTTPPTFQTEYSSEVALFGAGLAQELYAEITLPQSYTAGTAINLYVNSYSPSSSGTQLIKAQCTLIRPGTDAYDSTTNQRTSTNAALTNTVAKQLRTHTLDIANTSGVNGVALAAGYVLKIRLYRDASDSDTADVRLVLNANDVLMS